MEEVSATAASGLMARIVSGRMWNLVTLTDRNCDKRPPPRVAYALFCMCNTPSLKENGVELDNNFGKSFQIGKRIKFQQNMNKNSHHTLILLLK